MTRESTRNPLLSFSFTVLVLLLTSISIPALAVDPVAAVTSVGSGDRIFSYSMDVASDGRIFVAAEVPDVLGHMIVVNLSNDGGFTWSGWSTRGFPGLHCQNPSLHIARGDVDRLFLAFQTSETLDGTGGGAVRVDFVSLDGTSPTWVPHVILSTPDFSPSHPVVTSDAHVGSDYGVFVAFRGDTDPLKPVYFSRSLDQGTSWEPHYSTGLGDLSSFPSIDVCVGRDDRVHLVWGQGVSVHVARATQRAASPSDWVYCGMLTDGTPIKGRLPNIAANPSTEEVFAAYSSGDTGAMRVQRSDDGGLTWSSVFTADELFLHDGEFDLGPLGYRLGGYRMTPGAQVGEPEGTDPDGPWSFRQTGPGYTAGHFYQTQIAFDPTHAGQVGFLGHSESSFQEDLLFWGEWFDESAGVPEVAEAPTLVVRPNPARSAVHIECQGIAPGPVEIRVHDVLGRMLFRAHDTIPQSGASLRWNLRDGQGQRVPDGTYFVHLSRENVTLGRSRVTVR